MSSSSWWQKILDLIKRYIGGSTPTPTPQPSTDILAAEKAQGFVWTSVRCIYSDGSWACPQAQATLKMNQCQMNGSTVHLEFDSPMGKWVGNNDPAAAPNSCCGHVLMFIKQADGSWAGGSFDGIAGWNGVDDRPLHHIWDQAGVQPYPGMWVEPTNGSQVAFVIVSYDGNNQTYGKERTTAGFTTWQR